MRTLLLASLLVSFVAGACGPSAQEIRKARTSGYQTDYANVWNAVSAQAHEEYPGTDAKDRPMVNEDATAGKIVTQWKKADVDQYDTSGDSDQTHNKQASASVQAIYVRSMITILPGGPPWRVAVDVEAAKFIPNMSSLMPYKHGAADEPPWVQGRIDHTYAGIYERLKKFAVDVNGAAATPPPASEPTAQPTSAPASQP